MTWQEARTLFPDQWLLFVTLGGYVDGDMWYVTELAAVRGYDNHLDMMRAYRDLRNRLQGQEVGFFHTARERIEIRLQQPEIMAAQRVHLFEEKPI